jgi:glutamine amidotransferase
MITIIDYGVGNVRSLVNMLEFLSVPVRCSADPDTISASSSLLLPGVGAFGHAMEVLTGRGLEQAILAAHNNGAKVLGVCLGMQLLANRSEEGDARGLGLIDAEVRKIEPSNPTVKVPHMGWCEVQSIRDSWLFASDDRETPNRFYFAHSYHMVCNNRDDVLAVAQYDGERVVAVGRGNVYGVQFHPEKSHQFGLRLFAAYASQMCGAGPASQSISKATV